MRASDWIAAAVIAAMALPLLAGFQHVLTPRPVTSQHAPTALRAEPFP